MSILDAIRGRDFAVPGLVRAGCGEPRYDSSVLNSTGVSALTLAGRLARSEAFADRVRIVAKPVEESRRLLAGVTLRARSLDLYAAAMGVERARLLQEIYGDTTAQAETHRQYAAVLSGTVQQGFDVGKIGPFMDRTKPRPGRRADPVLAYGVRNSRLRAVLQKLALETGVTLVDETVDSVEGLRQRAAGENPLVVNGTPRPLAETPLTHDLRRPTKAVAAAQLTFRATRLEQRGLLSRNSAVACWVLRDGALDMGVYYPFQDELNPEADYYGIFFRVEPFEQAKVHKESLLQRLESTAIGVGHVFGLEPVDRDETLGTALVPFSSWKGNGNCQEGVLDLSRLAGAGAPIITGDGMTRSAIAGLVGAESVLAGRDPVPDIDRSLGSYRQLNWELYLAMTRLARPATWLMKRAPSLTLYRQTQAYARDMWAGVD